MDTNCRIVFEHHGDRMESLPVGISTVNTDGTNRALIRETGSTPTWSPDGRWIAFHDVPQGYEGYATNIFIMRPDGRKVRQLTFHTDGAATRPRWAIDSRTLVYCFWINQKYQMFTVDARSARVRRIRSERSLEYPEWTPDGDIVALDTEDESEVVIMSEQGGALRRCTLFQPGDEEMVWSPDRRKIAFVRRPGKLCFMNQDGSELQEFKFSAPGKSGALSVAWLPDSRRVAFAAQISDNYDQELFLFDLTSERYQPIVKNPCPGDRQSSRKQQYAAIIDVSCSPFLRPSRGLGTLARMLGRKP